MKPERVTSGAEPIIPRTVKQLRSTQTRVLPVIAVDQDEEHVLLESDLGTGELLPLSELPRLIQTQPPSMIVTVGAPRLLYDLDSYFDLFPLWQYRVTPEEKQVQKNNGEQGFVVHGTIVHFFGFQAPKQSRKTGHFHYPVDPFQFTRGSIHQLIPGNAPTVAKLMTWGRDLREWCQSMGIQVKPSSGGIAGQLLRHPQFFPEARRKVPKATNAHARLRLPGNHYRLYTDTGSSHQAYYLDCRSSHHNIAATIPFPDPDDLYARGRFMGAGTEGTDGTVSLGSEPWIRATNTRQFDRLLNGHGLLYAHLSVPTIRPDRFPPPFLEKPGSGMHWIWTNEVPTIRELGATVDWVTAAWVSFKTAPALNRYAEWAMSELDAAQDERKRWLKATLLATYGVLAARPRVAEYAFKQAKGGEPREYPAGAGMLKVVAKIGNREQELPTANVIYRGMIEAEQRKRSLDLARSLHGQGVKVLAVYADSVFVDSTAPLPFLPEPWIVQDQLDRLQFLSSTAFTSAQLTKLPGVPRESAARVRILERMGRSVR